MIIKITSVKAAFCNQGLCNNFASAKNIETRPNPIVFYRKKCFIVSPSYFIRSKTRNKDIGDVSVSAAKFTEWSGFQMPFEYRTGMNMNQDCNKLQSRPEYRPFEYRKHLSSIHANLVILATA